MKRVTVGRRKFLKITAAHASSFLILSYVLHFAFPSAGAVDKIVFPEGMQSVNFCLCKGLTGTAELGDE